jgi:hypothetical protein
MSEPTLDPGIFEQADRIVGRVAAWVVGLSLAGVFACACVFVGRWFLSL